MSKATCNHITSRRTLLAGLAAIPAAAAAPALAADPSGANPELLQLVQQWEELHRLRSDMLEEGHDEEAGRLCDAEYKLADVILEWPARCVADLLAKTRLIACNQEALGNIAAVAEAARQCEPWSEGGIALAVVRDLLRITGQASE